MQASLQDYEGALEDAEQVTVQRTMDTCCYSEAAVRKRHVEEGQQPDDASAMHRRRW